MTHIASAIESDSSSVSYWAIHSSGDYLNPETGEWGRHFEHAEHWFSEDLDSVKEHFATSKFTYLHERVGNAWSGRETAIRHYDFRIVRVHETVLHTYEEL
jgi:hypothetical protein